MVPVDSFHPKSAVVSIDPRREKQEFALIRQMGSRPPLQRATINFTHGVWNTGPGLQSRKLL
jgi:hypothetical protein